MCGTPRCTIQREMKHEPAAYAINRLHDAMKVHRIYHKGLFIKECGAETHSTQVSAGRGARRSQRPVPRALLYSIQCTSSELRESWRWRVTHQIRYCKFTIKSYIPAQNAIGCSYAGNCSTALHAPATTLHTAACAPCNVWGVAPCATRRDGILPCCLPILRRRCPLPPSRPSCSWVCL